MCNAYVFNSLQEFLTLRKFKVMVRPPKAPEVIEVGWRKPLSGWLKVNTNDAALASPRPAGAVGVFKNCFGNVIGYYTLPLGIALAFYEELATIVNAIFFASEKGWSRLWIESDSLYVVSILFGEI
ncbi:hypothetical protein DITRI_Ditri04bG0000200 [Diplodiscus trichospermus]